MRIVIIGVGRVGARLANLLDPDHEVSVVDTNDTAFRRLRQNFRGVAIRGNAINVDTLRQARADKADILIACTNGDNRNLMVAQIAKDVLGVSRVIARVYDPVRAAIFRDLGLDTISPTVNSAERLFAKIVSA